MKQSDILAALAALTAVALNTQAQVIEFTAAEGYVNGPLHTQIGYKWWSSDAPTAWQVDTSGSGHATISSSLGDWKKITYNMGPALTSGYMGAFDLSFTLGAAAIGTTTLFDFGLQDSANAWKGPALELKAQPGGGFSMDIWNNVSSTFTSAPPPTTRSELVLARNGDPDARGQGPRQQGNRWPLKPQHLHGQQSPAPHLRETPCPLPRRGSHEIHSRHVAGPRPPRRATLPSHTPSPLATLIGGPGGVTGNSIVQCRSREWVLLPSDQEDLLFLWPLTGATDEVVAVHKGLGRQTLITSHNEHWSWFIRLQT